MNKNLLKLIYCFLFIMLMPTAIASYAIGAWSYNLNWTPALIQSGQNYIDIDPNAKITNDGEFIIKVTPELMAQLRQAKNQAKSAKSDYQVFLGVLLGEGLQTTGASIFANTGKYKKLASEIIQYIHSNAKAFNGIIIDWEPTPGSVDPQTMANFADFVKIVAAQGVKVRVYLTSTNAATQKKIFNFTLLNPYIDKYEMALYQTQS